MRRALVCVVLVAACGRYRFEERVPGDGGPGDALGDGPVISPDAVPACVPAAAPASCTKQADVTAFALGGSHACAMRTNGLQCWGSNADDQLGLCAPATSATVPTPAPMFDVAQIATGENHTCVRTAAGQLLCWGSSFEGEAGGPTGTTDPDPRLIDGAWLDVTARRFHTCGIRADRSLWCWGRNSEGELGIDSLDPTTVPARVGTATNWTLVRAGGLFTCGLQGTVASCWGDNPDGQLGDGTRTRALVPSPVAGGIAFAMLAGGKQHMCGLDIAGIAWCWGQGMAGQLGNGKTGNAASETAPFQVPGGPWTTISSGWFQTCTLDAQGALYCWGENTLRNLSPMPINFITTPLLIDPGPFDAIASGLYITCARSTAGELRCWGINDIGQLGVGDTLPRDTPTALCFSQ